MESVADSISEEYKMDQVKKDIEELEKTVEKVRSSHRNNKRSVHIAEKHSEIAKLKRARSIQACKKTCIDECPLGN